VTAWTDERMEAALAGLADELVVPTGPLDLTPRRARRPGRWLLAAAAVAAVVALVAAVVPAGRRAVAGWLGLGRVTVERVDPGLAPPRERAGFAEDVTPLDVDAALTAAAVDAATLDVAGLGRPEAAGRPPEGGVVLAWDGGATTLWVRRPEEGDDAMLVKRLTVDAVAEPVADVGEAAVLVDGAHELTTPARTVAADRVLWWIVDDVEHRLETDRPRAELVAMGRTLSG